MSGDLLFTVEQALSRTDVGVLENGLGEHALPFTGVYGFRPLGVFARGPDGDVRAGAVGRVNWNWLDISLVWVAPGLRHQGIGEQLMAAIENAGRERGCRYAHLDTFSYQARPFYERLGYRVFATLDDYPPGHQRFYLRKELRS